MSRTRIVKGKITEIVGGDLRYYSESDITESAAESYSEKSGTRILHEGNPGSPPPSPTLAKCAVFFRPLKNWKGEFGFDWVRVADSKLQVDISYNGIIGKYGNIYATEPSAKFTADSKKYKNNLSEYNSFSVYKGKYYVPNMTLTIGETATLDAIVHVEEKADKLHYSYNNDIFELTILKQFTVAKGVNYDESSIRIKCKKSFSSPETIRVIATKNKLTQKVGEIKVLANNSIKNINILLIPVTIKKMGATGGVKGDEKTLAEDAFNQAYIKANISEAMEDLEIDSWWFNWFFTTKDNSGKIVMDTSGWRSLHVALEDEFFDIKDNEIYRDYYRVYMLPTSLNLNGIAEGIGNTKVVAAFQNRNDSSTAHELLHAMGLYHTFDNDSPYTFELYKTDNIMDYTHHKGKKRFTTNKFQWKTINTKIK